MKLELSEEQQMIQTMAREFAESAIRPIAAEIDREARFPHETVKRMGELGLMGIAIPEQWGGSGADAVAYVVALEEIARICASHAVTRTAASPSPSPRRAPTRRTSTRSPCATATGTS
jgi:alkylation response protein AidB-like acyl-CoA dehydrogenase